MTPTDAGEVIRKQIDRFIEGHACCAADTWFREQCTDPFASYFLWYRPGRKGLWGAFLITKDIPNNRYTLASPERISPAWTRDQTFRFVISRAQSLPILPVDN